LLKKRQICKRINHKTHRVKIVRRHKKHHHHVKRHHKKHHVRRHHKKHHRKHHHGKKHHKRHHHVKKHHKRHHKKHHHGKKHHKHHHGKKHHKRHHKKHIIKKHKLIIKKRKVIIKKEKKVHKIYELKRNQVTCTLYADPHVQGFNRKTYDAQKVGDWVLYRGENLAAHYRGKSMGVWVGSIKFGIRLFHHRIYTTGFNFNTLKIDGKVRNIKEGKNKVGKRGTITKVGTKVTFSTNIGEEVDLIAYGYFFNAYVRSRALKVSGICSQQFIVSKFFQHPWAPKHSHLKKTSLSKKSTFYIIL